MLWQPAQRSFLADGRLHLHHGPIDLIIDSAGKGRQEAFEAAWRSFEPLLAELAALLPELRKPVELVSSLDHPVANAMRHAAFEFLPKFVTPMAAVAGAVGDHVLGRMVAAGQLDKAYVNNGGDIAFHIANHETMTFAAAGARFEIGGYSVVRGVATSGWRGRSLSMGIADSVTVAAQNAALADVAATLIANEIDLPNHPAIYRKPARDRNPESDLGERLVTVGVETLKPAEVSAALARGANLARQFINELPIEAVWMELQGQFTIERKRDCDR